MKGALHTADSTYVHCAIMGEEMVGKTSISESYDQNTISEQYEATVFDNYVVPLIIAGQEFAVSMFDTSAEKSFENLRAFAYQRSEVVLMCFSTCDRHTFSSVTDKWLPELKRHSKTSKQKRPVILVGTQIDLRVGDEDSEVSADEGVQLAKDIGADCYVECSARDQKGLEDVFKHIVFSALKFRKKNTSFLKQLFRRSSGSFKGY